MSEVFKSVSIEAKHVSKVSKGSILRCARHDEVTAPIDRATLVGPWPLLSHAELRTCAVSGKQSRKAACLRDPLVLLVCATFERDACAVKKHNKSVQKYLRER